MADYEWPEDIEPYAVTFYLQPHTGGSESPFNRKTKTYGLSAPRWICRLTFRGGDSVQWGTRGPALWGQRLDAFLAKLEGRQNRVELFDFRRRKMSSPHWPRTAGNNAASLGATTMTITGLAPGTKVHAGDYIGGDGRPHIVLDDVVADSAGTALVTYKPPLKAAIGANEAVFGNPTGLFKLTSDDAGENASEIGQLTQFTLEFVEDL